jgi:hypothetical protein
MLGHLSEDQSAAPGFQGFRKAGFLVDAGIVDQLTWQAGQIAHLSNLSVPNLAAKTSSENQEKPGRLPFFLKGKWGVVPAFPAHRHKINRELSPLFPQDGQQVACPRLLPCSEG